MNELIEILMEKLQESVKQNIQYKLKEYQGTTNKKLNKTQKQLNELREDINKLQSETEAMIKKEIYEIKKTAQDMKGSLTKIWKTSEKRIK
jgi:hypothetical protein